jgi:hypothetical protein
MELVYVHKSLLPQFIPRNLGRLTLRHTESFPGGLLTYSFPSFPIQATCKDKCETCHCKTTPERRVKCFTLESTSHLEDTSRKPELGTSGSPSVLDYSVEYYLRTDEKAKQSSISASKPVRSNKVAMAKFSLQAIESVPPCRPLVVRWPVSALQTIPQEQTAWKPAWNLTLLA